jgi:hypothetical protein
VQNDILFSALLGVSRQGEFENTGKEIEYVCKKTPGKYFFGGGVAFRVDLLTFCSFGFFCCVG